MAERISADEIRRNMQMFEALGARRVRLSADRCGYVHLGSIYPCFGGHEHFHDEQKWIAQYAGPLYSRRMEDMMYAEAQLEMCGLHYDYIAKLVPLVCPKWENLAHGIEVWEYWFQLAHAQTSIRIEALWSIREQARNHFREDEIGDNYSLSERDLDVLARAIELAPPEDAASADRESAGVALRSFVQEELSPAEALVLLSLMYIGRGDYEDVQAAVEELATQYESNAVIANTMLSKGRLMGCLRRARERYAP